MIKLTTFLTVCVLAGSAQQCARTSSTDEASKNSISTTKSSFQTDDSTLVSKNTVSVQSNDTIYVSLPVSLSTGRIWMTDTSQAGYQILGADSITTTNPSSQEQVFQIRFEGKTTDLITFFNARPFGTDTVAHAIHHLNIQHRD